MLRVPPLSQVDLPEAGEEESEEEEEEDWGDSAAAHRPRGRRQEMAPGRAMAIHVLPTPRGAKM